MTSTRRTWTLGIVSVALFMGVLDNLVVSVALPSIHNAFGASIQSLEWTVNAYVLAFAVLLLTGAALGDRFGRKRIVGKEPPSDGGASELSTEIRVEGEITKVGCIREGDEQGGRSDCAELAPRSAGDGLDSSKGRPGEEHSAASIARERDESREAGRQREVDAGHADRRGAKPHAAPHPIGQERYREPTRH
jgi:hypothetical protein